MDGIYSIDGIWYLIGGLEQELYDIPYIGNFNIPIDFHSIIFQRSRSTTNQFRNSKIVWHLRLQGEAFKIYVGLWTPLTRSLYPQLTQTFTQLAQGPNNS